MQKKDWEKITPGKSYIGGQNGLEMGIKAKIDKKWLKWPVSPFLGHFDPLSNFFLV